MCTNVVNLLIHGPDKKGSAMDNIMAFWNWLNGKKTVIVGFALAVVAFLSGMGWITPETAAAWTKVLSGLGVATVAHKGEKILTALRGKDT